MTRPPLRRFFRHGLFPQLVAFECSVRHASVTRAAEELSLAQPTVSGMLRKLAESIREPILAMHQGRMRPTAAGEDLVVLWHEIFAAVERYDDTRRYADLADRIFSSSDPNARLSTLRDGSSVSTRCTTTTSSAGITTT